MGFLCSILAHLTKLQLVLACVALLLLQDPANVSGKAKEDGLSAWVDHCQAERFRWSSWLPDSVWSRTCCHGHLGNELANARSFSLS